MLPAATYFLTGQPSGPDFVIPLVIIWSYVGAEVRHVVGSTHFRPTKTFLSSLELVDWHCDSSSQPQCYTLGDI